MFFYFLKSRYQTASIKFLRLFLLCIVSILLINLLPVVPTLAKPGLDPDPELPYSLYLPMMLIPPSNVKPDLVVRSIKAVPATPIAGQPVTLQVEIQNTGAAAASGTFYTSIYIDPAQPPSLYQVGDYYWSRTFLDKGATTTLSFAYSGFKGAGKHTVSAQVDSFAAITESVESNNVTGPVTFTVAAAQPDLVITDISTDPAVPSLDQPATLKVKVKNQGLADVSTPFEVESYLDTSTPPAPDDPTAITWWVNNLAVGQSVELTHAITFTGGSSSHKLYGQVDITKVVAESNETNNSAGPYTVKIHVPLPDLTVTAIHTDPAVPTIGHAFNVLVEVKNSGDAAVSQSFRVDWYLDPSAVPTGSTPGNGNWTVPSLGVGQSTTLTASATASMPGSHTLYAQVDVPGAIEETSETNNLAGPTDFTVEMPKADLVVNSITLQPEHPIAGEPVTLKVVVRNQGYLDTGATFRVDWYRDLAAAPAAGQPGDASWQVNGLSAGASTTLTTSLTFADGVNYRSYTWVDRLNDVEETDHANNILGPSLLQVFARPSSRDLCAINGGSLDRNLWLTTAYSPYILTNCSLSLPSGNHLLIDPGVIVKLQYTAINAASDSQITALGTQQQPIVFTSYLDDSYGGDTNGDGRITSPSAGNWWGIHGGLVDFDQVLVRYGGGNYNSSLSAAGNSSIKHVTIDYTASTGISVSPSAGQSVLVEDSLVRNGNGDGVIISGAGQATINRTTLQNVAINGILIYGVNAVITNNTIRQSATGYGSYAISVANAVPQISGNTLQDNPNGISISSPQGQAATLSNNTITRSSLSGYSGFGLYVADSAPQVTGNTIAGYLHPLLLDGGYPTHVPTFTGNTISDNGRVGVGITGKVNSGTWGTVSGYTPYVYLTARLADGETFTFPAGAIVKLDDAGPANFTMGAGSTLTAAGTAQSPVIFTSIHDDSYGGDLNNNGGATIPARGNWGSIGAPANTPGALIHLTYVLIRYGSAYPTYYTPALALAGDATVQHATVEYSGGSPAIMISPAAGQNVLVEDSTARNGNGDGVYISGAGQATVNRTTVQDVATNGILISGVNAVITNNTIRRSASGYYASYAISVNYAAPQISGNTLQDNPNGIYLSSWQATGTAAISSNTITRSSLSGYSGFGLYVADSTPQVTGNTIAGYLYPVILDGGYPTHVPAFSGNTISDNGRVGVGVTGKINGGTWGPVSGYTAYVYGTARLADGASFNFPAGSIVKLDDVGPSNFLLGNGSTLTATGTAQSPVVFTSIHDDSYGGDLNNNGGATIPIRGNWGAVGAYSSVTGASVGIDYALLRYGGSFSGYSPYPSLAVFGNGSIKHATIEYGGSNPGIFASPAADQNVLVEDSTVRNSNGDGIYISGAGQATVNRTTIQDVGYNGISISGVNAVITNNTIRQSAASGSGSYAITVYNATPQISGNTLQEFSNGISISSPQGLAATISNNTVTRSKVGGYSGYGLYVRDSIPQVTGNTVAGFLYPVLLEGGYPTRVPAFSGNTISDNGRGGLAVTGVLEPGDWGPVSGYPVFITGSAALRDGKTFNFPAGSVVKFDAGGYLNTGSGDTTTAHGTASSLVVFTSIHDDDFGGDMDKNGPSHGAPGDWGGISTQMGSLLDFDHVRVRYGGGNNYIYTNANLSINGSVIVKNTVVEYSRCYGIYISVPEGALPTVQVEKSNIRYNGQGYGSGCYGVFVQRVPTSFTFKNNEFWGNGGEGLYNADPVNRVDAINNWWGNFSGPTHPSNPSGTGEKVSNQVLFDPWTGKSEWIAYQTALRAWWTAFYAEPVNVVFGNYLYHAQDLNIPSLGPAFTFERNYNSMSSYDGPLGFGWGHSYDVAVTAADIGDIPSVLVRLGDGGQLRYFKQADGSFQGPVGSHEKLELLAGGLYRLTFRDQTVYNFAADGRLGTIVDHNGNKLTLSYTGGLLTQVTLADGRVMKLEYDGNQRLAKVTDPLNRSIQFGYDPAGNLASASDPLGNATHYTYDAQHRLLTATDANEHTFVRNEYDENGRVLKQYDADNQPSTFAYDLTARQTITQDPAGNSTTYHYDSDSRIIEEIDVAGGSRQSTYDSSNNRTMVKDELGNQTSYTYDERGNPLTKVDALNNTTAMTYDARNNLLTLTDAKNQVTTNTYDSRSNLISSANPLGGTVIYAYNNLGQRTSLTDENGHATQYGYDAYGNLNAITDSLGNVTHKTYDLAGRVLTVTDPLGRTTTNHYDAADRLLDTTDALNQVTHFTYDAAGNQTSVTDALGHTITYTYNAKDRKITTTDPLGRVTKNAYDALDLLVKTTDPLGQETSFAYDALKRKISATDPLGHLTQYTYDKVGNLLSETDPAGFTTAYTYDALYRLTQVQDAAGSVVSSSYDALGNRTGSSDANGHPRSFGYDALNRLVSEQDALGNVHQYTYDAVGNKVSELKPDGVTIAMTYDKLNRLIKTQTPEGSTSYTYDAAGNRLTTTDASGLTQFTYDELNRITQVSGPNGQVRYGYDAVGHRTSLVYPGGMTVTDEYDAAGQLTKITEGSRQTTTYTYTAAGRLLAQQNSNGTQASYEYDGDNRPVKITHTSQSGGTLEAIQYVYDSRGNRTEMTDAAGKTTYLYDQLNRLTSVTYPDGENVAYTYDAMGNRLTQTSSTTGDIQYAYNAADRLTSVTDTQGTTNITWDANGNMLQQGSATYTWDSLNRLTGIHSGSTSAAYTYSGDGVRLSKTVNGLTTAYVNDQAAGLPVVLAETSSGQTRRYVYGLGLTSQVNPAGDVTFYHADALGSTRRLSNASGQASAGFQYDAFGAIRAVSGTGQTPFTYAGEQLDAESGLQFLRARYYDPQTGRFLSADIWPGVPAVFVSQNPYAYADQNPVNKTDPTGHSAKDGGRSWGSRWGGGNHSGGDWNWYSSLYLDRSLGYVPPQKYSWWGGLGDFLKGGDILSSIFKLFGRQNQVLSGLSDVKNFYDKANDYMDLTIYANEKEYNRSMGMYGSQPTGGLVAMRGIEYGVAWLPVTSSLGGKAMQEAAPFSGGMENILMPYNRFLEDQANKMASGSTELSSLSLFGSYLYH